MTDPCRIPLPAELDLRAALPLRDQLAEALEANPGLELDGAAVERVSTACLQVLLAAARQADRAGQSFAITDPSQVLAEAVADLALDNELPLRS